MMNRLTLALAAVVLAVAAIRWSSATSAVAPTSRPTIDVQVASMLEIRGTDDQRLAAMPLRIWLSLNGDLANVRGIPEVHILECRDDLGDMLRDETGRPVIGPSQADGKLRVGVAVSQPPRRAQQISLKGRINAYTGGKMKTLTFDKLKSRVGTKLSDPLLTQAGLEVSIGRVSLMPAATTMTAMAPPQLSDLFETNGVLVSDMQGAGISEVRLLDADGKTKFHTSHIIRTKNGLAFNLNRQSITDATTLQIDVYTEAEPIVGDFELKDIRLP